MFPNHDHERTRSPPRVTAALVVVNLWAWIALLVAGDVAAGRAWYAFGVVPAVLTGRAALPPELQWLFPPFSLLTGLFLHAGMLHVVGNLLYLWLFGRAVEHALGARRFLALYLGCGVFAGLAQACATPLAAVPVIGAGGAVSGVLGAGLLLHPRASVALARSSVRVPAAVLLLAWCALQLAGTAPGGAAAGVAWYAHLGGFVCGLAGLLFLKRRGTPLFD